MPTYLLLNSESEFPQDWRLADEISVDTVEASLWRSMRTGELLQLTILVGEDLTESRLFVNGSKLTSATVVKYPGKAAEPHSAGVDASFHAGTKDPVPWPSKLGSSAYMLEEEFSSPQAAYRCSSPPTPANGEPG